MCCPTGHVRLAQPPTDCHLLTSSSFPPNFLLFSSSLPPLSPADGELEQIDFIDNCVEEEEEGKRRSGGADRSSLSSQFMAYIERRITREVRLRPLVLEAFIQPESIRKRR